VVKPPALRLFKDSDLTVLKILVMAEIFPGSKFLASAKYIALIPVQNDGLEIFLAIESINSFSDSKSILLIFPSSSLLIFSMISLASTVQSCSFLIFLFLKISRRGNLPPLWSFF
jgi:hypothetical protein